MLDPKNASEVAGAGIGVAIVAFALIVIYFVGSVLLNNIWVVAGISVVGLFIAIAVKVMSNQGTSH
jgi:cobalamin biosynthesis protein CobD/CbiB